ncbi:hypothetical protein LCGC14_1003070 [marine sediment metagenome]|uniref:Uncharacterized protein n=1 Tax=marine sediment metagenome TaxID=412755 RepID=A0A0F9NNW5_9ZZZZ
MTVRTPEQWQRNFNAMIVQRWGEIVLDRATCDWVIDRFADTAICRTHGEVVDGLGSKHFPGNGDEET